MGYVMNLAQKYGKKKVFLGMDHSQLEIRVLGQMSRDRLLIQLLQSGEDIHSAVGHELTGIPIEKIKSDRETRTAIKGIHFGIIYGLSPKALYFKLKIEAAERGEKFTMTEEEVTALYNKYFQKFKRVKKFLDDMVEFAVEHEYVETMFGFRREISIAGEEDRATFWKNQAVNSPIQGTAHQLIMISLAILELKKQTYNLIQDLCMEVHDSLVCFVNLEDLPAAYHQGVQLLEKDVLLYVKKWWPDLNWVVPLKADAKAGFRMGVMVDKYKGEPPEEFVQKWCEKNLEFEKKLAKEMKSAKEFVQ
jgi:DNA polymerase I